jgi:hypothetical protein
MYGHIFDTLRRTSRRSACDGEGAQIRFGCRPGAFMV